MDRVTIINYVMHTPGNTNPFILDQMLRELEEQAVLTVIGDTQVPEDEVVLTGQK